MKVRNPPSPKNLPSYKSSTPLSGNIINGLGEKEPRRPKRVFHSLEHPEHDWAALNTFFLMNNSKGILWEALKLRWKLRRAAGPVAPKKIEVTDIEEMSAKIKKKAKELGAGIVGITEIEPSDMYEGVEQKYQYAICLGVPMEREQMQDMPSAGSGQEVQRAYSEVSSVAVELSEYIRSLGWPAYGYGDPRSTDILHIPMAIRAGIGDLGKHGSLICKEYGSNVRLSTVTTNLPLATDEYTDIGVDDICLGCRRCTIDCPPDAITDEKKMVRGEERWYVDFDKCIPYFSATMGCAICIQVCPWSEPGRGPGLSEMLLAKRDTKNKKRKEKSTT